MHVEAGSTPTDRFTIEADLPLAVLDAIPNPVLVKDAETRYVWVNRAFELLFDVRSDDLVGRLDRDVFRQRQAAQCNGGDLRVLESGETDEAEETVFDPELGPRQTITRKQRLVVGDRRYLVGVIHDVTEVVTQNRRLQEATEQLRVLASIDPLTGCLNRRAMYEQANQVLDASIGVILIDLDDFKRINDTYGHDAGDLVLQQFAAIVRDTIRDDDLFARLGGEEFALLLPGATDEHTRAIAERICDAVAADPINAIGESILTTVSVGALCTEAPCSGEPSSLDDMLIEADARLYEAKHAGRNQVVMA